MGKAAIFLDNGKDFFDTPINQVHHNTMIQTMTPETAYLMAVRKAEIREAAKALGLPATWRGLALLIGVSTDHVCRILNGRTDSFPVRDKLSRLLGIPIEADCVSPFMGPDETRPVETSGALVEFAELVFDQEDDSMPFIARWRRAAQRHPEVFARAMAHCTIDLNPLTMSAQPAGQR